MLRRVGNQSGELDNGALPIFFHHLRNKLEGKPRLAYPSRADQAQHAAIRIFQELSDSLQIALAPHEAGGWRTDMRGRLQPFSSVRQPSYLGCETPRILGRRGPEFICKDVAAGLELSEGSGSLTGGCKQAHERRMRRFVERIDLENPPCGHDSLLMATLLQGRDCRTFQPRDRSGAMDFPAGADPLLQQRRAWRFEPRQEVTPI